jgi:HD-like signal output (HDOD) protein
MNQVNKLVSVIQEKINNDKLILPTLPKIALEVRRACDDPETDVNAMVIILQKDPAISARLIKYANSAFMKRQGIKSLTNLNLVVGRIGLEQIRNIATAMAMEQLFVSSHQIISDYISKAWNKTVKISSFSTAFLKLYNENNPKSKLNTNDMTLLSLIHNIGLLPILTEAEIQEGDLLKIEHLDYCIDKFSSQIGVSVVSDWNFSQESIHVIKNWNNFDYVKSEPHYIDFLRMALIYNDYISYDIDKDKFYNLLQQKGLFENIEFFESKEFKETYSKIYSVFQ